MIYTVTLNPALDKTVEIPGMALDTVNRITEMRTDPGGKGINVSKVIAKLGGDCRAVGILGGESGRTLEKLLENENFTTQFRFVEGQTRTNIKIIDRVGHTNTDINEPGLTVTDADLDALLNDLLAEVHAGDIVVLAGSLPKEPGIGPGEAESSTGMEDSRIRAAFAAYWAENGGEPWSADAFGLLGTCGDYAVVTYAGPGDDAVHSILLDGYTFLSPAIYSPHPWGCISCGATGCPPWKTRWRPAACRRRTCGGCSPKNGGEPAAPPPRCRQPPHRPCRRPFSTRRFSKA